MKAEGISVLKTFGADALVPAYEAAPFLLVYSPTQQSVVLANLEGVPIVVIPAEALKKNAQAVLQQAFHAALTTAPQKLDYSFLDKSKPVFGKAPTLASGGMLPKKKPVKATTPVKPVAQTLADSSVISFNPAQDAQTVETVMSATSEPEHPNAVMAVSPEATQAPPCTLATAAHLGQRVHGTGKAGDYLFVMDDGVYNLRVAVRFQQGSLSLRIEAKNDVWDPNAHQLLTEAQMFEFKQADSRKWASVHVNASPLRARMAYAAIIALLEPKQAVPFHVLVPGALHA